MQEKLKIVITTGPECTGKTFLCEHLAKHYGTYYIPEYARSYIENIDRSYTYDDVLHIANEQKRKMSEVKKGNSGNIVFMDTYLIITKKWFEVVYGEYPLWLDQSVRDTQACLYLLCYPDLEWFPDKVRENGGEMRKKLFDMYLEELEKFGLQYAVIKGVNDNRYLHAITEVDKYIKQ